MQLREQAGAVFLYASMAGLFQQMDGDAFKLYRDQLLADSGNPSDPIEIMMIEQIALAHVNIGRLQFRSATAQTLDAAKAYGGMAAQLFGEFRRTALALQAFRFAGTRGVNPVVLEAPRTAPTLAAEPEPQSETIPTSEVVPEKRTSDTELEGKELAADGELIVLFPLPQESQTGGGRETEPDEVARILA